MHSEKLAKLKLLVAQPEAHQVDTAMVCNYVTAAWQLYAANGWDDRSHREVITADQIKADGVRVPALQILVRDNVYEHIGITRHTAEEPMSMRLLLDDQILQQTQADSELVFGDSVLKRLCDKSSNFRTNLANALQQPTVSKRDIMMLCYLTPIAKQIRDDQQMEEIMSNVVEEYVGNVLEEVTARAIVIRVTYNHSFNTYNHTAVDTDGHLLSFFYKTKLDRYEVIDLRGKVRGHGKNMGNGMHETRLNYVKLVQAQRDS